MKSIKCPSCGLTNWSTTESCKRCAQPLGSGNAPAGNYPAQSDYFESNHRQMANHPSPPEGKSERLVSFGMLLIILGGILSALFFGAMMRGVSWPLHFAILGVSILASGVVFCMKEWAAVYVYLGGFVLAAIVVFMTEDSQKFLASLAFPGLIGLFLLNKMLKAKKSQVAEYAGQ
jgi:hypothetical protein